MEFIEEINIIRWIIIEVITIEDIKSSVWPREVTDCRRNQMDRWRWYGHRKE